MLKQLFAGIVCVAAIVFAGCSLLVAADKPSVSLEAGSVFAGSNASVPADGRTMFKPAEVPESFIAPDDWEIEGTIIGSRDDIHALSQNDVVFVDVGSDDAVTQGTRCVIYRKGDDIKNAGIMLKAVGEIEITGGIREKCATARILYAHEPIRIGDIIEIE